MTDVRVLGGLGSAAASARRIGLGRPMNAVVDAVDGLLVRAEAPLLKATFEQIELRGYLRHRGFLEYVERGMREEAYYRSLLLRAIEPQTTFVDAGAHIGVYTLLCRGARRVVAFEPDPYNFAALRRNVARAGCTNVELRREAVADRGGRAEFRAFRSTFSGSLVPRAVDAYHTVSVETIALDDVLDDSDFSNLVVKLDVEGAEPQALAGMTSTIQRAGDITIFTEVNAEALEAGGSSVRRLVDALVDSGLNCVWIDEDRRTLVPGAPVLDVGRFGKGNLMCKRANG